MFLSAPLEGGHTDSFKVKLLKRLFRVKYYWYVYKEQFSVDQEMVTTKQDIVLVPVHRTEHGGLLMVISEATKFILGHVLWFSLSAVHLIDASLALHLQQIQSQGKTSPTGPPKPANKLDNMLGSLQSDLNRLGVQTVAKGVCGACKKPIVGQVMRLDKQLTSQ